MSELEALHQDFAKPGIAFASGPGEASTVMLQHKGARVRVCTQGAHVLSYVPCGHADVLWLSPKAVYSPGKAIRGGIPICWPWFSDNPNEPHLPAHGFARNLPWALIESSSSVDNKTVVLTLCDDASTRAMWPHPFRLDYRISLSDTLYASLTTTNTGSARMRFTEALHSYFSIADITEALLLGLGGHEYLDKVESFRRNRQQEEYLRFCAETDRVYLDCEGECTIDDVRGKRRIRIAKAGSRSTVVWNPWSTRARELADFPDAGYTGMLCVETANAGDEFVELAPGASHTLSLRIEAVIE